jgi:hypothetical protein
MTYKNRSVSCKHRAKGLIAIPIARVYRVGHDQTAQKVQRASCALVIVSQQLLDKVEERAERGSMPAVIIATVEGRGAILVELHANLGVFQFF